MLKTIFVCFTLILLMVFHSLSYAQATKSPINFPKVSANVAYPKVADLPFTAAKNRWAYGDSPEQFVLFWPAVKNPDIENPSTANKKQSVVFIHGGCWLQQYSIDHSFSMTTGISQQGFDVYSIEYRRTGSGGEWPGALHDIQAALDTIIKTLPEGHSISLLGHSAGGHLAAMVATRFANSSVPLHVYGLAPIVDIEAYSQGNNSCQSATPLFMQGSVQEKPQVYKQASPLAFDFANTSSITLFAGDADSIVPANMAAHPDAQNIIMADVGHFDWIHPGSAAFKRLIATINSNASHE